MNSGEPPGSGRYDVLAASGAAALNGTLHVGVPNGYLPSHGDVFPAPSFTSLTGVFAGATGLGLGNGDVLTLAYAPANLELVA